MRSLLPVFNLLCCLFITGITPTLNAQTAYILGAITHDPRIEERNHIVVFDLQSHTVRNLLDLPDRYSAQRVLLSSTEDSLIVFARKKASGYTSGTSAMLKGTYPFTYHLIYFNTTTQQYLGTANIPEEGLFKGISPTSKADIFLLEYSKREGTREVHYLIKYNIKTNTFDLKTKFILPYKGYPQDYTLKDKIYIPQKEAVLFADVYQKRAQGGQFRPFDVFPLSFEIFGSFAPTLRNPLPENKGSAFFYKESTDQILVPIFEGTGANTKLKIWPYDLIPPFPTAILMQAPPTKSATIPVTSTFSYEFIPNKDRTKAMLYVSTGTGTSISSTIYYIDLNTLAILGSLPVNASLSNFFYHPTDPNMAYAVNRGANTLLPFSLNTFQQVPEKEVMLSYKTSFISEYTHTVVTSSVKLPPIDETKALFPEIAYILTRPVGYDSRSSYVGNNERGKLQILNQNTMQIQQTLQLDVRPEGGVFHPTYGNLYIFHSKSQSIKVFDAVTLDERTTIPLPFASTDADRPVHLLGINKAGNWIYLLHYNLHEVSAGVKPTTKLYAIKIDPITLDIDFSHPNSPISYDLDSDERVYINPDGSKLAIYDLNLKLDKKVRLFDIAGDSPFSLATVPTPLEIDYSTVTSLASSKEWENGRLDTDSYDQSVFMDYTGTTLYLWSKSGTFAGFETVTGTQTKGPLQVTGGEILAATVAPNGENILANTINSIKIIDLDLTNQLASSGYRIGLSGSTKNQYIYSYEKGMFGNFIKSAGSNSRTSHLPDDILTSDFKPIDFLYSNYIHRYNQSNVTSLSLGYQNSSYKNKVYPAGVVRDIIFPTFPPDNVPPAGGTAYIANNAENSISILDLTLNAEVARLELPSGSQPSGVSLSPDGQKAYICNQGDNKIQILNTASNELSTTPIDVTPANEKLRAVAISPDGTTLYATTLHATDPAKSWLKSYDIANGYAANTPIEIAGKPDWLVIGKDGTAYMTGRTPTGAVLTIVKPSVAPVQVSVGAEAAGIALSTLENFAYVGVKTALNEHVIVKVDLSTNTLVAGADILVPPQAEGLQLSKDGLQLYVSSKNTDTDAHLISCITLFGSTVQSLPLPAGSNPGGLSLTPDGKQLLTVNEGGDNVTVLNTDNFTLEPTPIGVGDAPKGYGNFVVSYIPPSAVMIDDTEAYIPITPQVGSNNIVGVAEIDDLMLGTQIATGTGPFYVIISTDGTYAYAADQGGTSIQKIDTRTKRSQIFNIGFTPDHLALNESETLLFVTDGTSNEIKVLDPQSGNSLSRISTTDPILDIFTKAGSTKIYGITSTDELLITNNQHPLNQEKSNLGGPIGKIIFHPSRNEIWVDVEAAGATTIKAYDNSAALGATPTPLMTISGTALNTMTWWAITEDGNTLYYTDNTGLFSVDITTTGDIDLATTIPTSIKTYPKSPKFFQIAPDGNTVYLLLENERRMQIIDVSVTPATVQEIDLRGVVIGVGNVLRFP